MAWLASRMLRNPEAINQSNAVLASTLYKVRLVLKPTL